MLTVANLKRPSPKIAVIGAGPMGLVCAYELLQLGYQVELYEQDDRLGGMSAAFDFDGLTIERYYHFICRTDLPLLKLLKELHIDTKLRWQVTNMGFFYKGTLYPWGNPWHLLRFPHLNMLAKLRYALHIFYTKNLKHWDKLDQLEAITWLQKWVGAPAYLMLWDYLFKLKFYEHKHNISAAWIGGRIKRVALSRKHLLSEQLGYLEGGSETLLQALQEQILAKGGQIYLKTKVRQIVTDSHQNIQGIRLPNQTRWCDSVVSTIPLPYLPHLAPQLPQAILTKIHALKNTGVVCVILKLRASLTENFWLNVNDPTMEIPGLIEYTNLCPLPERIIYVPFYLLKNHPKYAQTDADFIQEVIGYLNKINPNFSPTWVLASQVSRYEFAQPLCTPHFYQKLPPMQTPLTGFFMADTAYSYPADRSISESVQLGKTLANLVNQYFQNGTTENLRQPV